ncbi:MAG: sensor histidine kinase [Nocardioides sp.]
MGEAEGRRRASLTDGAAGAALCSAELSPSVELLIEAVLAVSVDLELDGILRRTVEAACVLTGASHGMVGLDVGESGEDRAILYGEAREAAGADAFAEARGGLVAEIPADDAPYARLHLAPRADGEPFNARDVLLVGRLAAATGQAISNAIVHRRAMAAGAGALPADEAPAVGAERERIARDLHDGVVQRLFATGLQLSALRRTVDAPTGETLTGMIRDLDATMRDLRATIYGLRSSRVGTVLDQIEALAEEYAAPLGFRPTLEHSGPVDELLEGDLGDHVLATMREALSNVVKHARATSAAIELHVSPRWTLLRIGDDGVGIPAGENGSLGSGLANLRTRAERLGGLLRIERNRLDWIVPTHR